MNRVLFALLALLAMLVPAGAADILDNLVNIPIAKSWKAQGLSSWPEEINDPSVQGGTAMRFSIPDKGGNPWTISAKASIVKPIKEGDVVLFAFWARAEEPLAGQETAFIPGIRIEEVKAPYGAFAQDQARISKKWTMYYASGVADKTYQPGTLTATLQLNAGKQVIDLGPVFVLDFGPDYDKSKLPHNTSAVAPAPPPAAPASAAAAEQHFAGEISKIRANLPVKGVLINDPSVTGVGVYGADISKEIITASDVAGGQAVRVRVEKKQPDSFSSGTVLPLQGDIRKGDTVFIAFYARAVEVSNEAQSGVISLMNAQLKVAPYTVAAGAAAMVPQNKWQLFYISGVSQVDIPAGSGMLTAQIASHKQVIDFGPAFVFNLGAGVQPSALPKNKVSYLGREPTAPWRAAAEARIREIRMGDLNVEVKDGSGKAVPGATVRMAMQKHLFRFGGYTTFDLADAKGRDGDKAREAFLSTFNFATSPIYWADWGWETPGTRDHFIANMKWLKDKGYAFRAHPVVWGKEDMSPTYIRKLAGDPAAMRKKIFEHVREIVPLAAKAGAVTFDVFNEPRDSSWLPSKAGDDIAHEVFRLTHELAPQQRLFINEYGIIVAGGANRKNIDLYKNWISNALAKNVPVSGIGIQGHFGAELTDPERVKAIFDEFAAFKLPIEITEFDVDTQDEDAQADYTRDMLTVAFAHPAVDTFITWDWRDAAGHPTLAMFRPDWSEKPNHKAWMARVYKDWWTDASASTGVDGKAAARAFYGDYKITVSAGGKTVERTVSFTPGSGPVAVTLN